MRVTFSPAKLARCTPEPKPYEVWDTKVGGLYVRVQPTGVRSFNVFFRGKRRSIGKVGQMTIDGARFKARQILNEAAVNGWDAAAKALDTANGKGVSTLRDFYEKRYEPHALAEQKDAKGNLAAILCEFGHLFDRPLTKLSQLDFERYKQRKLAAGAKPATVNRNFDRIRTVLLAAVKSGYLPADQNPLAKVSRPKEDDDPIVRYLSEDEEARLRKALAERDTRMHAERANANRWREARGYRLYPEVGADGFGDHLSPMILLSLHTGMRRGELTQITWADVDLSRAQLAIRAGYAKSRRTRHIPLNTEAVHVLTRWKLQAGHPGRVFGVARVDKAWKAVLLAAKIKSFRWHDQRHHFASRLVMHGVDLNTVRELLGHSDIAMTLRYAHLAPEHKAEAVAKLVAAA